MSIEQLQQMFNRALERSFCRSKLLISTCILALCGLLVVFFRAVAVGAGDWLAMSLLFLPIFLCSGVLLSLGIILTRVYHDEIKGRDVSYRKIIERSWEIVIGASYFCVPIILSYLLMWMLLGVFLLLREIPGFGDAIGVVLSFGPFLINLGSLLLCVLNVAVLFFITPAVALRSVDPVSVSEIIAARFKYDVFSNLLLALVALIPMASVVGLLSCAAVLTGSTYIEAETSLHITLYWFFIMLPFTALLSPAVVFFFNFAAEGHVAMRRMVAKAKEGMA